MSENTDDILYLYAGYTEAVQRVAHHLQSGLEFWAHYLGYAQPPQRIHLVVKMYPRHNVKFGIDRQRMPYRDLGGDGILYRDDHYLGLFQHRT